MTLGISLASCDRPLATAYDVGLLDLDGVVYLGLAPVPHAAAALAAARGQGMRLAFVTNNASRTPDAVAAQLVGMGIDAAPADVVTSSQAAMRLLRTRIAPGDKVLVVGDAGLRAAVEAAGFVVASQVDDAPAAVVQGYSTDTGYAVLAEAALALAAGVVWVATNTDTTIPTPRGLLPGNGAFVAALRAATGRDPLVAGKPEPALHEESVERTAARRPLIVGDRLDTDVRGAVRARCDSLVVLTGVVRPADLVAAAPGERPSYLAGDLTGLLEPHPVVSVTVADRGVRAMCGRWTAAGGLAGLALQRSSVTAPAPGRRDVDDALRALCAAGWAQVDGGRRAGVVTAVGDDAAAALEVLGLSDD